MKRKMTKIAAVLLAVLTVMLCMPISFAADVDASGKCGDNLTWTVDCNELRISGEGEMWDFEPHNAPWNGYAVHFILIGEGVTSIGDYAFQDCALKESLIIPENVESVSVTSFPWDIQYGDIYQNIFEQGGLNKYNGIYFLNKNIEIRDAYDENGSLFFSLYNDRVYYGYLGSTLHKLFKASKDFCFMSLDACEHGSEGNGLGAILEPDCLGGGDGYGFDYCEECQACTGFVIFPAETGHSYDMHGVGYVEPTEDTPGYSGDTVCSRCGTILEYGKVIPPLGETTEPDTTEPDTTEPDTAEPDTTEPDEDNDDGDSGFGKWFEVLVDLIESLISLLLGLFE